MLVLDAGHLAMQHPHAVCGGAGSAVDRNDETERAPRSRLARHLDPAAKQRGEPLGDVQPETRAAVAAGETTVELEQRLEENRAIFGGNPHAPIANGPLRLSVPSRRGDLALALVGYVDRP